MFRNLRLFLSQVLSCSVYYEIEQRKKASNIALPSFTHQSHSFPNEFDESPFARYRLLSRIPRTTRKNTTPGQHWYAVGRTGWFMDSFANHSKPSSIGQKHSHCLANYSNSVVVGYPGRKVPWKVLTIVCKGKPLPESPLVCSCSDYRSSLPCYGGRQGNFNYKLWFEAIQFFGRRTVLSMMLAWFSRKSAHIWTRTSSSSSS